MWVGKIALEKAISGLQRADAGQPQLTDQAILEGAPQPFDAALRLRRERRDHRDTEIVQQASDLRWLTLPGELFIDRLFVGEWTHENAVPIGIECQRECHA